MNDVVADDASIPAAFDQLFACDNRLALARKCEKNFQVLRLKPLGEPFVRAFVRYRINDRRADAERVFRRKVYSVCNHHSTKHTPLPFTSLSKKSQGVERGEIWTNSEITQVSPMVPLAKAD
jgi:hypothetical protein